MKFDFRLLLFSQLTLNECVSAGVGFQTREEMNSSSETLQRLPGSKPVQIADESKW